MQRRRQGNGARGKSARASPTTWPHWLKCALTSSSEHSCSRGDKWGLGGCEFERSDDGRPAGEGAPAPGLGLDGPRPIPLPHCGPPLAGARAGGPFGKALT